MTVIIFLLLIIGVIHSMYVAVVRDAANPRFEAVSILCIIILFSIAIVYYNQYTKLKLHQDGKCPELEKVEYLYRIK